MSNLSDIQRLMPGRAHSEWVFENSSTDPTVVEYANQSMLRGKSPAASAKFTAKKLGGGTNMFIGGGGTTVSIDPKKLEAALWDLLVDSAIKSMDHYKAGKEHMALDGTAGHWKQKAKKFRPTLKAKVIQKLGHDPFPNDDR